MIALQTRGAKLPDPAAQTAKFVSMMNMTRQQEAAERQAALAQQQMDINLAREERDKQTQIATMREKNLDIEDKELLRLYKIGAAILETEDPTAREAGYQNLLGLIEATSPQLGATMRQVAGTFNAPVLQSVMMETEQYFNKKYTTPTTETIFGPKNEILELTKGGIPGVAGLRPVLNKPAAGTTPTAPPRTPVVPTAAPEQTTPGPIPVGKYGETRVAPDGGQLDAFQQDHVRQMKEGLGMTDTPASFSRGSMGQMSPDMVPALIDSAVKTGVMAQIDLDQMLALAPVEARQGIVNVLRSNNVSLQADAPSLVTSGMNQQQPMAPNPVGRQQSTYADMRGLAPRASFADLGSAPPVQNTMAQTNVMGQQAYGRSASPTSPIPGSSLVAPQVLGNQKAAETAGSENVKVGTQPRIVAGEERVRRLEKLRGEMPIAQAETQTLVNSLTGRINAIDEYLRSGSRNSIIGTVEGRIPKFFQSETRADAQGLYDYITSNTVLQKLIDDRGQTETGGSPQGVVSDADLKVAAQASTKLTQTGSERKQEIEMQRLRDELYRTRGQAIQKYNNVYREVIKEAPELGLKIRPVAPKYKSAPQTPTRAKSLQNIFGG
jgi:hypothetical protein